MQDDILFDRLRFVRRRRAETISAIAPLMVHGSLSLRSDNPANVASNPGRF